jgi:choline monooxygenase
VRQVGRVNEPFDISSDIRRAWTIPSRVYHDPGVYAAVCERVLARSWQLVGDAGRLKAPGHVIPLTLLEGSLDEPLVLTRGDDGVARCLSNVCTHRGMLVVEGEGHVQSLRCRYHGRRFELDGRFRSMPEFESVEGFPSAADDLPRLPLRQWGPFLFASLDPMCDFEDWIRPVRERVDWLAPERLVPYPAHSQEYVVAANWALYCDNYLEGFHVPYVHGASLGSKLDYEAYDTELFEWSNLQIGVAAAGQPAFELPEGHPDRGTRIAAWYFWLFPNLMLNFYPWGLSVNVVEPLGPTRTRVRFHSWAWDPSRIATSAASDLHRVEMEDEEIVEAVQKATRSRLYDRGRYSPRREQGPHHFHRLLAKALEENQSR